MLEVRREHVLVEVDVLHRHSRERFVSDERKMKRVPYTRRRSILKINTMVTSLIANDTVALLRHNIQQNLIETRMPFSQCSNWTGMHRDAIPVLFGRPERRSGPFKTTRLMVKLQQAYVLASECLVR